MYLKKIEMKGFKSFADKLHLEFDRGIAAIVGPNGSGKSNIADGVRWVLGEQSAKALRGSKMEDVIFSGTDNRKALGFAEVSITIDNGDGTLPIDYSEVMVTRRVYRSGESEYYLNKTGCRLKDINELFMDTGVGKEGYSIIGQGRIDEILSSKAEERRRVFEEAAGIVKYKTRKEEAERKMQKTKENLLRLGDIIEELASRVGPLQSQSETAKTYIDMRDRLKGLELSIFATSIERLNKQKANLDQNVREIRSVVDDKNITSTRLESEFNNLETKIQQMEQQLKEVQQSIYSRTSLIEKKEGEIRVLEQKIRGENESINMHQREFERIEQEIKEIEGDKNTVWDEMENLKQRLLEKKQIVESFQANLESIDSQAGEEEERVEKIKARIIDDLNEISILNSKTNSLKTLNETIYKRKIQLLAEMEQAEREASCLNKERTDLKQRLDTIRSRYNAQTKQRERLLEQQKGLQQRITGLEKQQRATNDKLGSDRSKLALLEQMERDHQGYSRSVKSVMDAGGTGRGIVGPVAELIQVKEGLERAIEIALGYSLQSIVTRTEEDAKSAIDYLKRNKLGRATFLPISSIGARFLNKHEKKALRMEGCIGRASELVECGHQVKHIIDNLLGRVVVVDSLDSGIRIARAHRYGFRIVTVDGDVINTGGSMSGGSGYSKEAGLLQRKNEIHRLNSVIEKMAMIQRKREETLQQLLLKQQKTDRKIQSLTEEIHELELERTRVAEILESKMKDLTAKKNTIEQLETEKLTLEADYYETQSSIDTLIKQIKEKEEQNRQRQNTVKDLQKSSREIKQDREHILQQITANRVDVARLTQKLEDVQARHQQAVSAIRKLQSSVMQRQKETEINRKNIAGFQSEVSLLRQEIADLAREKEEDNKEFIVLRQADSQTKQRMKDKELECKEIGREIAELQKKMHKIEVQLTRVEMELRGLHDRMWEEYEMTHIQALDYRSEIVDEKKARRQISELKVKIKELGNVNINAIEEYAEVKKRLDFLNVQREDLEEARDSLKRIITEMLETMKKKFGQQLQIINERFNIVFRELFGGGKAKILLSDQDNILESGIEIIAQPPGKKLQQLSLLSGGEKALAAIALLFAILSVKPSPFCILDEIEAALDDANVERFSDFLKKLSTNIQFIIITHRKGTMEIANSLYGVTMEEKGVSKLVSVKLEDMVS